MHQLDQGIMFSNFWYNFFFVLLTNNTDGDGLIEFEEFYSWFSSPQAHTKVPPCWLAISHSQCVHIERRPVDLASVRFAYPVVRHVSLSVFRRYLSRSPAMAEKTSKLFKRVTEAAESSGEISEQHLRLKVKVIRPQEDRTAQQHSVMPFRSAISSRRRPST
jgi:hypothetical protein